MHCVYCKKRLWLPSSRKRRFCSELHEAAYHNELSAMNRLMEFTVPVEPPKHPANADQKRSQRERESRIPMAWPAVVPPLCDLVLEQGRPKPVPADPATSLLLEAIPFAGQFQFPSSSKGLFAFSLDSATEPAREIATIANERIAGCRVRSKPSRRIPPRSPAAFSSRTHRRRLR
jgi:hypothetical protein